MRNLSWTFPLAASLSLVLSGCGSSGNGSGLPQGRIHTNLYNNGVYTNWPNSYIYANAVQFGCVAPYNGCDTSSQGPADANGNYSVMSNAVPGTWNIAAQADGYCPAGAGTSTQQLDPNTTVQIDCGNINQTTAYISPTQCEYDTYLDGTVTNSCPPNITATISGSNSFPMDHAMNVSTYTEGGANLNSINTMASSSTTLNLPTPQRQGDNVVVVRDPNNNAILAAVLFTYTVYRRRCNTGPGGSNQC